MKQFSFNELTKKDIFAALKLWVMLEFCSFVIFPLIGVIQPGDRLQSWFWTSLPMGIGGAILVGMSSRFVSATNEREPGLIKDVEIWAGQAIGWLGLMGVAFPLLMVALEFLAKLFREIQGLPGV